jgi:ABC-2 type transport system permease protein
MKLLLAHTKAELLALLRTPGFLIPTMLFPSMFFLMFAAPNLPNAAAANFATGSFMTFAVFTVTFFQFGVGTANERENPWSSFVRTLPAHPIYRNGGKVITAAILALLAALVLVVAAHFSTPLDLPLERWPRIFLALAAGGVMMGLLGTALAYLVTPKAALPLANLIYLPLAFMGGMWMPPELLPKVVQAISPYLPSRQWMELVWPAVSGRPWEAGAWLAVGGFTVGFALLAAWAERRDETVR